MSTNKELHTIIRELAEIYDTQSKNTFISVYVNKRHDEDYLKKRATACQSLLNGEEKVVLADKSYHRKDRKRNLRKLGIYCGIMAKGSRHSTLSSSQQGLNRKLAPARALV